MYRTGSEDPHWSEQIFLYFGPSEVRALPLAAGMNEGGHYWPEQSACAALGCRQKRRWPLFTIGPSGVRALPLAAGMNEGGHYWSEHVACASGAT